MAGAISTDAAAFRQEEQERLQPRSWLSPFWFESRLPLSAHSKQEDRVDLLDVAAQRHVSARTAADHQLPFAAPSTTPDQRVVGKNLHRIDDAGDALWRAADVELREVVEDVI